MLQCFISHDRSEIGTTDTDVDDVANALAGVAFPLAASHAVGEVGHLIEDRVDLRHNILAVNNDRCSFWCTQSHVQNSAVFRDVDLLSAKHRVNTRTESRLICEL